MNAWPFVAFTFIFAALVCAHFFLAYRAWWRSRGEEATDIDPNYVRLEDYFARSFRLKLREWLDLPVQAANPDGSVSITKGAERIRVIQSAEYPPQSRSDDILVVRGSFRCCGSSVFSREIYVRESASIGPGSRLQSIAADGNLVLGSGVSVARWADCLGDLEIGPNATVRARATAGKTLCLGYGAQVGSAFAPTIFTHSDGRQELKEAAELPAPKIEIPFTGIGKPAEYGVDLWKLRMLSTECWLYDGDLKPFVTLRARTKLIVKGDCVIPAGSILEGDLKAEGSIQIGARSICRGNVVAGGDIWLGPSSRFSGIVHAGKTLRLGAGVLGGTEEAKVAAFATDSVLVDDDVIVHGKLASGDRVVVRPAVEIGGRPA